MGEITGLIKFFIDFVKGDIDLLQLAKSMIKYILTLITANILFKWWFYDNYSFIELSMENISKYIFSGEIIKPIVCFLAAYIVFYGVLFSLLRYLLSGWMERKITKKASELSAQLSEKDKREIYYVAFKWLRKYMRGLHNFGVLKKEDFSERFDTDSINELSQDVFTTICICIHALVVYGFFYKYFTVGMVVLYVVGILAFAFMTWIPLSLKLVSPILNRIFEHEEIVRK